MGSSGLKRAAEKHLRLLADDVDVPESLERYYYRLAVDYGIDADRVAELSGRPLVRVRRLIGGA